MAYCPVCGKDIGESSFCPKCVGIKEYMEMEGKETITKEEKENKVGTDWIIISFLIPILGILGGLYFATQDKKGAWGIVGIGIFASIIYFLILSAIQL